MGNNFSDFDVPGSLSTEVGGVNNIGDFCGSFADTTGFTQGFVSLGGTITTFSVPGAASNAAYQLNSSNQLDGYYIDSSGILHGYCQGRRRDAALSDRSRGLYLKQSCLEIMIVIGWWADMRTAQA